MKEKIDLEKQSVLLKVPQLVFLISRFSESKSYSLNKLKNSIETGTDLLAHKTVTLIGKWA